MFRLAAALILSVPFFSQPFATGAQLISSTYLRAGFSPVATATDSTGNVYLAGNITLDSWTTRQGVLVLKLNSQGTQTLFESYVNGSSGESVAGIAVDSAGNIYVTGSTRSADFPITLGGGLTTPPTGSGDRRPFVTRLDPNGIITFSSVLGGPGGAAAIAIATDGNILVGGLSDGQGFTSTPKAYSVPDTTNRPFLIKLDPQTPKIVFSATGIGGSSIAQDTAGDIFVSGSTTLTGYPTTPGAYQTQFPADSYCEVPCQLSFPAPVQYVTKIDPTASKLIYSTGLNPPDGVNGAVTNAGLVVDSDGNAYVTGTVPRGSTYPFTTSPAATNSLIQFITKLDPLGSKVLFSVPAGGAGLLLDGSGNLYAAGILTAPDILDIQLFLGPGRTVPPPVPAGLPADLSGECLPNNITAISDAYLQKVDSATGVVDSAQFIDASIFSSASIALGSQGEVWLAGAVSQPDTPFTPNAILPYGLQLGLQPGAYLASAVLSQTDAALPVVGCVLEAATSMHVGLIAPKQLLTIIGLNLGPAKGVTAPSGGSSSLGGVTVTFGGTPAQLLYVSSSQINVAVPAGIRDSTVMEINFNGALSAGRLFPVVFSNPSFFASLFADQPSCSVSGAAPPLLARNADGSINSCAHTAKPGSVVSFYLNGVGNGIADHPGPFPQIADAPVLIGGASAEVVNFVQENAWVTRVDVRVPSYLSELQGAFPIAVTMQANGQPVGPLSISLVSVLPSDSVGSPVPLSLWVEP
jgi:uncharacterized protein (TIGR03437 family)